MKKKLQQQKGFGLIEIIVSLTIIIIVFVSFLELAKYTLKIQKYNQTRIEAINLAAETIEAVRSNRNENWDNFAALVTGIEYYPVILENKWTLTTIDPGLINQTYSRWVILETVYRDANDDISASGLEDNQTRKITAVVEWIDRGETKQTILTTYLTNWAN